MNSENYENEFNDCNIRSTSNSSIRKKRVIINESIFDLIKRLNHQNVNVSKIAEITELSKSAIYKALAKIEEYPNLDFATIYGKPGRKKKKHPETVRKIKDIISEDQSLTQKGIQTKMLEFYQENVGTSAVCRLLKEGGLKRKGLNKKASVINTESHQEKMRQYACSFIRFRTREIIFLDETGFNLHSSVNYGYAEVGVSPVTYVPASKGKNLSACCMMSTNGIIHYKIIDGGFNGNYFFEFLQDAIQSGVLKRNMILVMDNATIHKTVAVKEFLSRSGVVINYLPPYSPDLNPIENYFSALKSRVFRKRPTAQDRETLRSYVEEAILSFMNVEDLELFSNLIENMWSLIYQLINGDR